MESGYFHRVVILSIALLMASLISVAEDTIRLITHNNLTVVTDPSKGVNYYKAWGLFPSESQEIRQIKLKLRLACPDSMRCADWDYKDHITIRRRGGVYGNPEDIEIGRMLTPYGGAFPANWQFNWEVDITDFSLLLRDSVEIEYNHTGYEPNTDRGWSLTLTFEIIKGTPAWEPISILKVYDGSYPYGDSLRSIEEQLQPYDFATTSGADFARLRIIQTGHGMDRPDGCGEFCNKYREIWFDEKMMDKRAIWKKCGDNPLYPQAGTWIYDRANWCPGDLMQPDIYDLPLKKNGNHRIDVNMQHYIAEKSGAEEWISAYIIQYRKSRLKNDIRVEKIISPSLSDTYKRRNPASFNPQIMVRNIGANRIKKFQVSYGTESFPMSTFSWKGIIESGDTATITLPGIIRSKTGLNRFRVELKRPNGRNDEYDSDNVLVSYFAAVPVHDSIMIVYLQTNNQGAQNGYTVYDHHGKIVTVRETGTLTSNTTYRDTLSLKEGHYSFILTDTAENGLEFWANPLDGRGKARLLNADGAMLKDFESDFGSYVLYNFRVGKKAMPVDTSYSFSLYPTRTNDNTSFDFYANFPTDIRVQLITDPGGTVVEEHMYKQIREGNFTYQLSRYPKGRFYLVVLIDGQERFKKRIRFRE